MKKKGFLMVVFTIMSFVLAMSAMVFGGILDKVAVSLGVSVADAGFLNTLYAFGSALGAPITLVVFRRIERIRLLKIMLLMFLLMTVALIFADQYWQMLLIRFMTGVSASSYGVLAIATVVSVTPRERIGRSLALLIAGSSLALVVGVPLTRVLSSLLDWRGIFWILIGMMGLSLALFLLFLPAGDHASTKLDLKRELAFLTDGKVVLVIVCSLVMFVGYNGLYTYLTPYLLTLFPALEPSMSVVLLGLGLASFIGNWLGGHASDRLGYMRSIWLGAAMQTLAILLLVLTRASQWGSVLSALLWLMSAWFTGLQLNAGISQATHNQSSLMLSLNSSAIQLGGAIGASMAAVVISSTGMRQVVLLTGAASLIFLTMQTLHHRRNRASKDDRFMPEPR